MSTAQTAARASGAAGLEAETPAHVLVVDDDASLRQEIVAYLSENGFVVHAAEDAKAMDRVLAQKPVQLVVLDVMMPGEDGLSACRRLADADGPPVLMLSALGEDVDRIVGLELGADDYLVKPVNPRELLARVRALLRRRGGGVGGTGEGRVETASGYAFSGFRLDLTRRQLRAPDGSVLLITPGEFSLLCAFLEHPRQVLSREELLDFARGDGAEVYDRAIDVQVSRLRRKLNAQSPAEIIRTHRGVGYLFDAQVAPA